MQLGKYSGHAQAVVINGRLIHQQRPNLIFAALNSDSARSPFSYHSMTATTVVYGGGYRFKTCVFCRDRLGTSENTVGTVGTSSLEVGLNDSKALVPTVPTVFSLVPSRSLQKATSFV